MAGPLEAFGLDKPPAPDKGPLEAFGVKRPPSKVDAVKNFGRALEQGATFGWGDDLNAYVRHMLAGEDYDAAAADERAKFEKYTKDNPATAIAGQIVGGAATTLLPMGVAARVGQLGRAAINFARSGRFAAPAVPKAAGGLTELGQAARIGAAEGTITGAGVADGDLSDRVVGAAMGGAMGAPLGAGVGAIAAIAPKTAEAFKLLWVRPMPRERARDLLLKAMADDGKTPEDVWKAMNASPVVDWETMADVTGPATRRRAEEAMQFNTQGASQAERFLEGRAAGQSAKIKDEASRLLGVSPDYFKTRESLIQSQQATAAPLYRRAYAAAPIPTKDVADLIQSPTVMQAYQKGQAILEDLARARGEPLPVKWDARQNPTEIPVASIDAMKRGLDDMIAGARDPKTGRFTQRGLSLIAVKNALLDRVDKAVPEYAEARAAFAGPAAVLDAGKQGERFMTMRPEEIERAFMQFGSPSEQDAFRQGALDSIIQSLDMPGGAARVRSYFKAKAYSDKIKALFDDPAGFDEFSTLMDRLTEQQATKNRVLHNSATARRLQGADDFAQPEIPSTAGLLRQLQDWVTMGPSNERAEVANEVTKMALRPRVGALQSPGVTPSRIGGLSLGVPSGLAVAGAPRAIQMEILRPRRER